MKRNSTSGTYTSPNTPDYNDDGNIQRGWYFERVPIHNSSRRHIIATTFMPFNSARALPSKWDDAEHWITSLLSIHGVSKPVIAQRKTKSKSGPLEICRAAYLANYLPPIPMLESEVKLENERSTSMEKIMKKLRIAEMKAEEARRLLLSESCGNVIQKKSRLRFDVYKKRGYVWSWFACHDG